MLRKGWIKLNASPYGTPVLFVQKNSCELQICIDFCEIYQDKVGCFLTYFGLLTCLKN